MSQVLKITSARAMADPRVQELKIRLESTGLEMAEDGAGGLKASGRSSGRVEMSSNAGLWWDSRYSDSGPSDPGGPGLARRFDLRLVSDAQGTHEKPLLAEVSKAEGVVYPVYVDPDWSALRNAYVYVDSGFPTTSYWNGQYTTGLVNVGFLPAKWDYSYWMNHTTRGYWNFNVSSLRGKQILDARFNVTNVWSSSCVARTVRARITGPIGPGTTWSNQPGWARDIEAKSFAFGNEGAGCGDSTVGFSMMNGADLVNSVDILTLGLFADNDTWDELSWKRFNNNASMIVTYNTAPNTPGLWTATYGTWVGLPSTPEYVIRVHRPVFDVLASDPDGDAGGSVRVYLTVRNLAGSTIDYTVTPLTAPGSGGHVFWQSNSLPDGKYFLEGQVADQHGAVSGVMHFNFTIDTTAPAPAVITPVAPSPFDASGTDPSGTVGVTSYSFTLNNNGPYAARGFVYALTNADAVPTFPGDVGCGSRFGEFEVVCPDGGRTATVVVGAVDTKTRLTVWSFDYAGNVNQQVNSTPASYTFTAAKTAPDPSTLLVATARGGASWVDIETNAHSPVSTGSCQGGVDPSSVPETSKALQLNGQGQYADTVSSAVDTAQSFSVSGWFCPTTPTAASFQSLITQMAGTGSPGGALRLSADGKAQFDTWSAVNSGGLESVQRQPGLLANTWYFVSAVYDKINKQLRITMTADGFTGTWTTATSTAAHLAAPATQPVLLGAAGSGGLGQFTGQILNPVMTQGVLTSTQFANAQNNFASTDAGVLK